MSDIPWPYSMEDEAVAIHEAIEHGHCEAYNPFNCFSVNHSLIIRVLEEHEKYQGYRNE